MSILLGNNVRSIISPTAGIVRTRPKPPFSPVSWYLANQNLSASLQDRIGNRDFTNVNGAAGATVYDPTAWPNGTGGLVIPYNGTQNTSHVFTGSNTYPFVANKGPFTIAIVTSRHLDTQSHRQWAFGQTGAGNQQINMYWGATVPQVRSIRGCITGCSPTATSDLLVTSTLCSPYVYTVVTFDGVNITRVVMRGDSNVRTVTQEVTLTQDVSVVIDNAALILLGSINTTASTRGGGIFKEAMVYNKALNSADCNTLLEHLFNRWEGHAPTVNPSDPLAFFDHRFEARDDVATSVTDMVPGNDTVSSFHGAGGAATYVADAWSAGKGVLRLPASRRWRLEGDIATLGNTTIEFAPFTVAWIVQNLAAFASQYGGWCNGSLDQPLSVFSRDGGSNLVFTRRRNNTSATQVVNILNQAGSWGRCIILVTYDGANLRSIVRRNITYMGFTEVVTTGLAVDVPFTATRLTLNGLDRLSTVEGPGLDVRALYVSRKAVRPDELTLLADTLTTLHSPA